MYKDGVVAYLKTLSWQTEENHEQSQSGYPISRLVFKRGTNLIPTQSISKSKGLEIGSPMSHHS